MSAPAVPAFGEALAFWLKLGFVSFGGPAGQIAIMHRELVERRRWISERRFLHALDYCMVLPGPEAQQLATYVGWLLHGPRGGIAAGALFVLPSLFLIAGLAWAYLAWRDLPALAAVLAGVKPAVVAIVAAATVRIGSRAIRHPFHGAVAIAAFAALALAAVPFPLVIALAALAGLVARPWVPARAATHAAGAATSGPAAIDDHTPPPEHAVASGARLARVAAAVAALWALPYLAIVAGSGADGDLARMARFFTQAALVTFGGAYAVLPYVTDSAVNVHGWATMPQVIDGLALGESTPGPLIMIVAFVGFVGGWTKAVLGPQALAAAGALGAVVATWFTFLPSFAFILAGAPYVERARGAIHLEAPLAAITAAVVGVIASLAVYFAGHVFLRPGGEPDGPALAIAAVAFLALWRGRAGVVPVIAASALAGLGMAAVA